MLNTRPVKLHQLEQTGVPLVADISYRMVEMGAEHLGELYIFC